MTERRKEDRDRIKLPNDLIEAIEERAKRRKLSNPAILRELLASADREETTAAELEAQRSILTAILSASTDCTRGLKEAQLIADRRHESVMAELRTHSSETVKSGAAISVRSAEQPAPRKVKKQGFDFTYWHLIISIVLFLVGYFAGLNAR